MTSSKQVAEQWRVLQEQIIACRRCPRLIAHCQRMAGEKRAAYRDWEYWGRPVPNLGPPEARLLIVGLAPAAHGANRTGRMFTGDRSGDFLFRAMYETGLATRPEATHRDDGLELIDTAITAAAHCAPPANKPNREELEHCSEYLDRTVALMKDLRGIVALGSLGFEATLRLYRRMQWPVPSPKPKFGHGQLYHFDHTPFIIASYHPSQQNTFTGRLTMAMLKEVFTSARREVERGES